MERRDFLKIVAAPASPAATVLYDDRSVALDRVGPDPKRASDALWIRKRDLPRVNGFELKPQFERAQALNPDDWNYHRQEWSVTPQEAGKKWLEKFLKPKGEKPKG
jgi:hypothetical protein